MIDIFAIGLTHGLILYACWRLLFRDDLDDTPAPPEDAPAMDEPALDEPATPAPKRGSW